MAGVVGNLKMGLPPPPNLVPAPDPADQHQGGGGAGAEQPPPPPMTTQHRSTGLVTVLPQHDGTRVDEQRWQSHGDVFGFIERLLRAERLPCTLQAP